MDTSSQSDTKQSLMEQILSKDNLNAAYLQVVRNKGAAGVDGMAVDELGDYLSENGESIREQLRTRKYKPQPVRRVEIPKPDGGVRNLGVPTVVDRFVQQVFFVKHFSLKKAFKFPFFIQGNSLLSAGTDHASWRIRACSIR
mgnify:CR=1 FL=1